MLADDSRAAVQVQRNMSANGHASAGPSASAPRRSSRLSSREPSSASSVASSASPPPASDAVQFKEQGNALFKAGNYEGAVEAYAKAIEIDPSSPIYLSNRAAALLMLKQWSSAAQDCLRAIHLDKTVVKAYMRLAKASCFMGKCDEALHHLDTAKAVCVSKKNMLDAANVEKEKYTIKRMLSLYEQADEHLRAGKYTDAVRSIESAYMVLDTSVMPSSDATGSSMLTYVTTMPAKWQLLRCEALLGARDLEEAQRAANNAISKDRTASAFLVIRAKVLYVMDTHSSTDLIGYLSQALSYDPDNMKARLFVKRIKVLEALKNQGNDAFKSGDMNAALECYTRWLDTEAADASDPLIMSGVSRVKVLSNRAIVWSKKGEHSKAIKDSSDALDLLVKLMFPRKGTDYHPVAQDIQNTRQHALFNKLYLRRADAELSLEQWEEAVRDYHMASSLNPSDASIKRALRSAQTRLKESKKKDYYKILELDRGASAADIKKAYRKLALQYHPDKCATLPEEEKAAAEAKFRLIGEAYAVLSDPRKKAMVDRGMDVDGESASGMGASGMGGMGAGMYGGGAGMDDILRAFMGAQGHAGASMHGGYSNGFHGGMYTSEDMNDMYEFGQGGPRYSNGTRASYQSGGYRRQNW